MLSRALAGLRTLIVMVSLGLVLIVALVWGWRSMTKPFPAKANAAVCVAAHVSEGDKIYPAQVVVSVLNASNREGLATRTMGDLTDEGFVAGSSTNAPKTTHVARVQIWTSDPSSPAARLVASWLHTPKIIKRATSVPGVVVVVGKHFPEVSGGEKAEVAAAASTICSPPADNDDS